jgi:(1->4)-alpha-D-glucan 1-alpha-D-glucosylmutase
MAEREALLRLCRHYGIAPDYYDIWGTHHDVSAANLSALLAAMGVPSGSDTEIDAATAAAESERWRALLPAAVVVREHVTPWTIRLHLVAARAASPISWRLSCEDGSALEGAFDPGALGGAESRELEGERYLAADFVLPATAPCGYHRLALLQAGKVLAETLLAVAPARCYRPAAVDEGARAWGAAVQLYSVRSERNWGMGDFSDLATIVAQWGARGAATIGINPLHALYPHNPEHISPYSPSSRCFLNMLYLDVEAIEDFGESDEALALARSPEFRATLEGLRQAELIDYTGVAALKLAALERCYAHFHSHHLAGDTARARAFRDFQTTGGRALQLHALFEALQEQFHRQDPNIWGWPAWPPAYRDPASAEVAHFAQAHIGRVGFYQYLQWQTELQLERVGQRSLQLGLGIGLYQDLAVSVDRGGAEAWAHQDLYALTASVGAPPDDFNLRGQDWGLPPLLPQRLRAAAYAPFIAMLRANMRYAGALRIDHVMGLARLFWVPQGGAPGDGAYVHYPFEDLLGILALESQRNRCLVIGEDLGTVPDEVRAAAAREGILSYRVLIFERRNSGEFKTPAEYPVDALVAVSTHDLPTLAGYWEGRDLLLRQALVQAASDEARQAQLRARAQDRAQLLLALAREQLLPGGVSTDPASLPQMTPACARALHAFLARSPSRLLVVQLEDVLGLLDQVNLPGTTSGHPNWRRRLPLALERWPADERFVELTALLRQIRPPA